MSERLEALKQRTKKIIAGLKKEYPDAKCALNFSNPLELMVATILSAQCTDKRVNLVTPALFAQYRTPEDYFRAPREELEAAIRTTGFYRNKAKSIKACCLGLLERFGGRVPNRMKDLLSLNGIGRKTANVILGTAYGIAEGVVVDTHVMRLSIRLGLTREKNPEKIEKNLIKIVPKKDWIIFAHLLILHGRNICIARKPKCLECVVNKWCPSAVKFMKR